MCHATPWNSESVLRETDTFNWSTCCRDALNYRPTSALIFYSLLMQSECHLDPLLRKYVFEVSKQLKQVVMSTFWSTCFLFATHENKRAHALPPLAFSFAAKLANYIPANTNNWQHGNRCMHGSRGTLNLYIEEADTLHKYSKLISCQDALNRFYTRAILQTDRLTDPSFDRFA